MKRKCGRVSPHGRPGVSEIEVAHFSSTLTCEYAQTHQAIDGTAVPNRTLKSSGRSLYGSNTSLSSCYSWIMPVQEGYVIAPSDPPTINWTNTIAFGIFHLGAVGAFFMFSWQALGVAVFLHWMCAGLGICMGYHRLHTHRSYQVPLALEYFFAICGAMTLEGGPIFWVATHRLHHQKSDQPGDPHSPLDGPWWAHMGWLLVRESEPGITPLMAKYAPDLVKHRFYVWLNAYHWVPLMALGVLLFAIGGVSFVLWGIFLRVVIGLHCTWLVNSATHMWGSRRFETRDLSRN